MERESETLFVFEGTRLICETRCSGYTHAGRYCNATGLMYASGFGGLDILKPDTGEWLYTLRAAEMTGGYGLPDVAERMIYTVRARPARTTTARQRSSSRAEIGLSTAAGALCRDASDGTYVLAT